MKRLWMLVIVMVGIGLVAGCEKKQSQAPAEKPPAKSALDETVKSTPDSMKLDQQVPKPGEAAPEQSAQPGQENEGAVAPKPAEAELEAPAETTAVAPEAVGPENIRRFDKQLEHEFKGKMSADNLLKDYTIKGKVKNGELTITGQVPREDLKTKAQDIAKTVTGLKGIQNNVEIGGKEAPKKELTDDNLRDELEEKMAFDHQLKDVPLMVQVKDGKATITGMVPSEDIRKKVSTLADTVSGMTGVDNQLKVQEMKGAAAPKDAKPKVAAEAEPAQPPKGAGPKDTDHGATPSEPRSDTAMSMELKTKILADNQLNGYDIEVDVKNAVINMAGTVPNDEMKRKAERLAKTVAGAKNVENLLQVTNEPVPPAEKRSDIAIKAELKAKLLADSELSGWKTKVEVNNGIVTVNGTVESEQARKKTTTLAETVAGVKEIRNDLQIKAIVQEKTADPAAPAPATKDKKPDMEGQKTTDMSDPAIARRIDAKYMAEAQLKGSDIQIEVKKGVATLSGTVRSEEQKQMAERMARQTDGVREVKNKLEVKPASKGMGG